MEDYIFLIIAVVISIFAAINKNTKNKMAQQPVEEANAKHRNFFMDQLQGEDFLEEPEEVKAPPKRAQPAPAKVNFKSSSDLQKALAYQLPRFKSTLPDRPKHQTIVSTNRLKKEEEAFVETEETPSYLEDFSLRKAIVYSQILEPKF
ncbi:MAG TPA: hypothetical protein VGK10_09330 [Prolixibacteraceae bacterium]|jgi:hypothetical protein